MLCYRLCISNISEIGVRHRNKLKIILSPIIYYFYNILAIFSVPIYEWENQRSLMTEEWKWVQENSWGKNSNSRSILCVCMCACIQMIVWIFMLASVYVRTCGCGVCTCVQWKRKECSVSEFKCEQSLKNAIQTKHSVLLYELWTL